MAVQPPAAPSPLPAPQTAAVVPPPAKSKGCLGCGMGCGGCLLVIVIVAALLLGSGYFFLVAQAQAGVASPAALLVFSTPVEVGKNDSGYMPAASGQSLDAGSSVRTSETGRATIQFPDGTLTRMSPNTTVTVQAAQLSKAVEAQRHEPPEEKEWDEFDYEKFMRESDARTDKYSELLDKYMDHPDRDKIIAALPSVDYKGVLGETRFDEKGDTLNHKITLFQVQDGKFTPLK